MRFSKFQLPLWSRLAMGAMMLMCALLVVYLTCNRRVRDTAIDVLAEHWRPAVVFVGDSLTAGGGTWGPRLGMHMFACRNLGHSGFIAEQMLPSMRQAATFHPAWISLCAGANDVAARHYIEGETVEVVRAMIEIAHSNGVRVVLTLVPQRQPHLVEIDELNHALLAVPADAFIDLSPTLAPAGALLDVYTTDGVHLSRAAYRVWAQKLRTVLNSHGLSVVHDRTGTPPSIGGRSLARTK